MSHRAAARRAPLIVLKIGSASSVITSTSPSGRSAIDVRYRQGRTISRSFTSTITTITITITTPLPTTKRSPPAHKLTPKINFNPNPQPQSRKPSLASLPSLIKKIKDFPASLPSWKNTRTANPRKENRHRRAFGRASQFRSFSEKRFGIRNNLNRLI